MRKPIAVLLTALMMTFGGFACDDNDGAGGIDEDDSRIGPGDGEDETGPGR